MIVEEIEKNKTYIFQEDEGDFTIIEKFYKGLSSKLSIENCKDFKGIEEGYFYKLFNKLGLIEFIGKGCKIDNTLHIMDLTYLYLIQI